MNFSDVKPGMLIRCAWFSDVRKVLSACDVPECRQQPNCFKVEASAPGNSPVYLNCKHFTPVRYPRYWMVFNLTARNNGPRKQHPSLSEATLEAERLAKINPGHRFVVLEAVSESVAEKVEPQVKTTTL